MFYGGVGLLVLALWIFCLLDVITTNEYACRNLPKTLWLILVLILPTVGSIAWLIAGRPQADHSPGLPYKGNTASRFPEYDRPGRAVAFNPEDDEAFLQSLRDRAEEQRRKAREQSREKDKDGL
ncbi:PLD nuclease N-terminal domain-containing protein [Actinomadura craniellae]|nr:PLD nuclease N-terminal domain-containing protein [Actinomadura craniellae]